MTGRPLRVLMWHVHGSYSTSFVQGRHTYLVPVDAERGPDGRGRARTWDWPEAAVEVSREEAASLDVDVVVLQRPHELDHLAEEWLGGRRPGRDVPAVYLEHNAPQGLVNDMWHPAADRPELTVVHVTHFNRLFWDCGTTPTRVIEHGIVDPGHRYTGELERIAVVINEPRRRWRVTGTDLLAQFAEAAPLDLFGMGADAVADMAPGRLDTHDDVPQEKMHLEVARRRAYLHPVRWTSLGLSLLEAMHLGMPIAALATTEVVDAVPPAAGVVSTDPAVLAAVLERWCRDPDEAAEVGRAARTAALDRYGLRRFLSDWDRLLQEVTA